MENQSGLQDVEKEPSNKASAEKRNEPSG